MIVCVTTLGAADGNAAGAVNAVVKYLDGRATAPGGIHPSSLPELPRPDGTTASSPGPGRRAGGHRHSRPGPPRSGPGRPPRPRPDGGEHRRVWDAAVGEVAIFRARWGAKPITGGPAASWALGPQCGFREDSTIASLVADPTGVSSDAGAGEVVDAAGRAIDAST